MGLNFRELADELDDLVERRDDKDNPLDDDEKERLKVLIALEAALFMTLKNAADKIGEAIDLDDFEDYCREGAYDRGEVTKDSLADRHVDWEAYADDCRNDYTEVEFDGSTYLYLE